MKIVVATKNKGKLVEIKKLLLDLGIEVISQDEANINIEVLEDGKTFEENSYKKAYEIMKACNLPTIADDSGLCVDFLNGAPGVYSARYAGENASDDDKINKLLSEMKNASSRAAKFVCCACLLFPNGDKIEARGECFGEILNEKKGTSGFGYDPVFYINEFSKTLAQMDLEQKNKISHRAKAFLMLKEKLKQYLN